MSKVLLIDNYDSFTHNLARYVVEAGYAVELVKNDEVSVDELLGKSFSHLIISPGPCTPKQSGISLDAIAAMHDKLPILGVCLGHQALGQVFGAQVVPAKTVVHGKVSSITIIQDSPLWRGIESRFDATRYHSLVIDANTLSSDFDIIAVCQDGDFEEVMAIQHRHKPLFGVQFHPESLLTLAGHKIIQNFLQQAI